MREGGLDGWSRGGSCLQSVDLHLTLLGRTNIFVYIQNFTRNVMGVGEGDGLGNDLDKIQFFWQCSSTTKIDVRQVAQMQDKKWHDLLYSPRNP